MLFRSDAQVLAPFAPDDTHDAFVHLPGRFVRERHREDVLRRNASFEQPRNPLRHDARFARARACENEHRADVVLDNLSLRGIEEGSHLRGGSARTAGWVALFATGLSTSRSHGTRSSCARAAGSREVVGVPIVWMFKPLA